jgi:hypothetical protein
MRVIGFIMIGVAVTMFVLARPRDGSPISRLAGRYQTAVLP